VIATARLHHPPILVVEVTAPIEILAARLAERGRESATEIAARLARSSADPLVGPDVVTLRNDGTMAQAVATFVAILRRTVKS
jgi:ribose 1,5-bisphosphokinase PhnN